MLIGFVSAYGFAMSVASIFSCHPVQAFWNAKLWSTQCFDCMAFWYSNAGLNIATDIAVVALPLYVLRDLKLVSTRQRLAVNFVFLVGAMYVSQSRLDFLNTDLTPTVPVSPPSFDFTLSMFWLTILILPT